MNVIKYILNNKLVTILNLILIVVPIFPFSYSYGPDSKFPMGRWRNNYIYEDIFSLSPYLLLVVFTLGFQMFKPKKLRVFCLYMALIISCVNSLFIIAAGAVPAQDFSIAPIILVFVFLPFLMAFIFRIEISK